jgi:capsular polysaccharide biosynthesis protein
MNTTDIQRTAAGMDAALTPDLNITIYRDLVAVPGRAALYTNDGTRVDSTNRILVPKSDPTFQKFYKHSPSSIEVPDCVAHDEPVLYLGQAVDHYGHFLIDSMARLWAALNVRLPCLMLDMSRLSGSYGSEILTALHLSVVSPTAPTIYRTVWVPYPAFIRNGHPAPEADAAHLRVTTALYQPDRPKRWVKPVFLSRSRFNSMIRSTDAQTEAALEQTMAEAGFEIVHPETLPLAEQIAIFNESPTIVGMLGSAFHTALFSRHDYRGRIVLLTWDDKATIIYKNVDTLKGYTAHYVRCLQKTEDGLLRVDLTAAIDGLRQIQVIN